MGIHSPATGRLLALVAFSACDFKQKDFNGNQTPDSQVSLFVLVLLYLPKVFDTNGSVVSCSVSPLAKLSKLARIQGVRVIERISKPSLVRVVVQPSVHAAANVAPRLNEQVSGVLGLGLKFNFDSVLMSEAG
jgi:hypothetical protein